LGWVTRVLVMTVCSSASLAVTWLLVRLLFRWCDPSIRIAYLSSELVMIVGACWILWTAISAGLRWGRVIEAAVATLCAVIMPIFAYVIILQAYLDFHDFHFPTVMKTIALIGTFLVSLYQYQEQVRRMLRELRDKGEEVGKGLALFLAGFAAMMIVATLAAAHVIHHVPTRQLVKVV